MTAGKRIEKGKRLVKTILGIHDGHNSAAALLENGRIAAAVQEERLTGVKNQGGLPREAIGDVLLAAGGALTEIEKVALNGNYMTYDHWDREPLLTTYEQSKGIVAQLKQPLKSTFVDGLYQRSIDASTVRAAFFPVLVLITAGLSLSTTIWLMLQRPIMVAGIIVRCSS